LSFGPRAAIAALGIAAWFGTQWLLASRGFPEGIGDRLHLALTPLTNWLAGHSEAANGLLIVTSGIIDALGCFLLLYGIFGPSVRPLLGLFILFILRQISQALTALPPPEGMIWRYPGFPSLLVTYETANDFFFSGHTAIAVYGAVELARLRRPWLTTASVLIAIIEPLTVLVLRAHYTMDIFTAILAAAWAASVALRLAPSCDRALTRWFTRRSDTKAGALVFSGGGHRCSKEGLADSRIFQENRRLREGASASENSGR
jgi:hypothetical protein